MFTCRSCMRKSFTTLINHTLRLENTFATSRPRPYSFGKHASSRRSAGIERFDTAWDEKSNTETITLDDLAEEDSEYTEDTENTQRPRRLTPAEWAARKHLQYLKDPLDIANQVRKSLGKDNFEEAVIMTRKSSRDTKVTVSWNHLIDYELKRDRIHAALKLYNEMKKRAQLPNAQTYTIIFRGCAMSSHPKLAVSEALRIYNIMLKSERIKPNTIHMNAVLQVCARSEDMEAMFSIVQTANEGIRAPNSLTYTTIINALRLSVSKPLPRTSIVSQRQADESEKEKRQAIQRARAVWEEVISKWRAGTMVIDEELVCAMGRILLIGTYHDTNSIGALLEQTMLIPQEDGVPISGPPKEEDNPNGTDTDLKRPAMISGRRTRAPGAPTTSHALPGNNSLALILSALEKTGSTSKSHRYWEIFTKKHHVVPDPNNWHLLFVALRRGKNSGKTVSYLREMPPRMTVPKTFRTAMSTCLRDNLNRNSFRNATDVLEIMQEKTAIPDMQTMRIYLRVAYANKRYHLDQSKGDPKAGMIAWGQQIAEALENLWRPYIAVSREFANNGPEANVKRELVALSRKMIAAADRIISTEIVTSETAEQLKSKRNNLNRIVVHHFEQMAEIDPNFKKEDIDNEEDEADDEEDFNYYSPEFREKRDVKRRGLDGRKQLRVRG
ncbi:uncharacterized protein GGS22DRAFT_198774 [Annulohypoxylon maeteangense]|uniref:uncharacterized protein n=1 Tax=Annulohypoxylon maeteangense TaxID=1927788 RepID=UPI002007BE0F|nr:uncharacterized protein GGS22DRAFT_198774 [Annulohypoxylon maeteangense]KAI0887531.1 hypothetical protein GGS22DRAFT_198774 [Annulohypoxylon maeteangense]